MDREVFVPELHDIGKLVSDELKENVRNLIGKSWEGHVFIDFNFREIRIPCPTSPSWWGQYHHACYDNDNRRWVSCDRRKLRRGLHVHIDEIDINNWNVIPPNFRFDLFLLIVADHLASSVSRATLELEKKETPQQKGILKLWNKNYYNLQKREGKCWAAFKDINDLRTLFAEIENCQSGEEFLSRYKDYLLLTPEDKYVPRNVTSLYTHIELVGKIYRVLKKNTRVVTEPDGTIAIEYNSEKVETIKEAEGGKRTTGTRDVNKGKWQARLVKCWIKFPHSFVRLRDINLLRKREELINSIVSNYKDEVIFTTSDFITLFLPPNQDLQRIFKPFLDWGFYIEIEETLADLGILNSILDRKILQARESNDQSRLGVFNSRGTKVYRRYLMPEMTNELQPHICDICQQRRGVERIKETIREWICNKCQEIREVGEPFWEYATVWEEECVKVCWFKFSLDQKKLEDWLENAFKEYVDWIIKKKEEELRNIEKEIGRKESVKIDKENEKKKLLEKVKKLNSKEKEVTGQKIKEISDEIKRLNSDIRKLRKKLEDKRNKLRDEINELELSKKEFRSLALQVDFNKDYKEMLKEFWKEFDGVCDIKKPVAEYDELGVFKFSPRLTKIVIEKFLDIFEKYFPDCASDNKSPISLSLSIANIKYPIREHWRFFEKTEQNFLNVRYHRVFEDTYTKDEIKNIVEKAINVRASSYFLHNLVQLEANFQSEIYLTVEIFNNRKKYPEIYELLLKGIKPSKFLNLYKLLRGEDSEIT